MPSFKKIRERAARRKGGEATLNKLLGAKPNNAALANVPDNRILSTMAERVFSAGFVWRVIEIKWPGFEEAFLGFEPKTLLFQPEDFWHDLTSDKRVVRNGRKIMSVRENAAFVERIAKEHGSFGIFLATWPADDQIGLTAWLGRNGSRLGGNTGQYLLRWLGGDTFVLSPDMVAAEGASDLQLTDEPGALEYRPVVKDVHGRPLAAFVSDAGDQFSISTRFLDHDGEGDNMTVIRPADAQQPQALALSAMGNHNAALAWVGPENNPGVWLQPLDEEGRQSGNPIKLTERVAVSSSVDLAQREDGGGVIYSIEIDGKPQVRFHRLDSEGMPIGDERVILGPPLRAQGASLHAIAGGYAVAYRALPGGSINSPEIRLLFISKEGNLMRDSAGNLPTLRVASATEGASRTSIAVSIEGQVMIAWVDAGSGDHNALKVVRHRLDCGP